MVMTEFERLCYSPPEIKKIEAGARKYDEWAKKELAKMNVEPEEVGNCYDIYEIIELDNLDYIRELHSEIGVFIGLKETFQDETIRQYSDYFIRINGATIEAIEEEIIENRATAQRLKELCGAGPDNIKPGDEARVI
jgi:hypothetical protein